MKQTIVNWIDKSVAFLNKENKHDKDTLSFINVFVTQYELNTHKILNNSGYELKKRKFIFHLLRIRSFFFKNNDYKKIKFQNLNSEVIFFARQEIHIKYLKPIFLKFKKNKISCEFLSTNKAVQRLLINENLSNNKKILDIDVKWVNFMSDPIFLNVYNQTKKIKSLRIDNKIINFNDVFLLSLINTYSLYSRMKFMIDNLFNVKKPKAIFLANSSSLVGNIISRIAKKYDIKVFVTMHGNRNDFLNFSQFDYHYVFGKSEKNYLVNNNFNPEKIVIAGTTKINKKNFKKKYVLVAFSGPGHSVTISHHKLSIKILHKLAVKYPEVNFEFKLHRKDSANYYKKISLLSNVRINSNKSNIKNKINDINKWLDKSICLITHGSTSALDAMRHKVPVITIDLLGHFRSVDFINKGITLHSTNFDNLDYNFIKVLNKKKSLNNHLSKSKNYINEVFHESHMNYHDIIFNHYKSIIN